MQVRTRMIAALCAAASVAAAGAAGAQEVRFTGTTAGCFGAGCTPGGGPTTAGGGVLSYFGSAFDETTVFGFLAIGGNPVAGAGNFNNFGAFDLNSALAGNGMTFNGEVFNLAITFTAPTGIVGGQTTTFTSILTGTVQVNDANGGVSIDFTDNGARLFTVNGVGPGNVPTQGVFSLQIADVNVNPTATPADITGNIQTVSGTFPQATVPEPSTYVLMATGLAGVAMAGFRRRRA